MKKILQIAMFAAILFNVENSYSQISSSNQWTWINGDNFANAYGIYGQKGVESPANKPGARRGASNWIDASGNLWLFGGWGYTAPVTSAGYLNDLWKYSLTTNKWTWIAGDSTANADAVHGNLGEEGIGYTPSARVNSAYWADATGTNLYLFGGQAFDKLAGDVWSFNTISNKWKWVKSTVADINGNCKGQAFGSAGEFTSGVWPVCRTYATAASAGSIAYVFGGSTNIAFMNDLYQFADINYTPANQWAYLQFTQDLNQPGKYTGENTKPGCRMNIMNFLYGNNYYVFGGYGIGYGTSGIQTGWSNDLWRYDGLDIFTQKPIWIWIKGDSTINSAGSYGTFGVTDFANKPPSRSDGTIRTVGNGRFILFGGGNLSGISGFYNDLWRYDVSSNAWTWIGGNNFANSSGNYGVKGIQQSSNMISARAAHACWVTANGDVYMFGGYNNGGDHNDLWKFSKPQELISIDQVVPKTVCTGGQLTISYSIHPQASNPYAIYNSFVAELSDSSGQFINPTVIGSVQSSVSGSITATIPVNTLAGTQYKIRVRSTSLYYISQPSKPLTITAPAKPAITTIGSTTIVCPSTSVTLKSSNASTYLWNTGATTQSITVNTPGSYTVTITNANGCQSVSDPITVVCGNVTAPNAYITNLYDSSVSVINTNSNSVIATIPVSTSPTAVVVSPDGNKVYITYSGNVENKVTVINAQTNTVMGSIKLNYGQGFSQGIDINPDGSKLFIPYRSFTSTDTIFVVNTISNSIIKKINLPSHGNVLEITVNADGSKAYAVGDGIFVINAKNNTLQTSILGGIQFYGVALNPLKPRLYACAFSASQLYVINTNNNSVTTTIPIPGGGYITGVTVSPDGSKAYVTNISTNKIYVVNTTQNIITDSIPVNLSPYGIDLSPDGSQLYVANLGSNNVSAINTSNNSVVANIAVGKGPYALGKFIGKVPCLATKPTISSNDSATDICPGKTITLTSSPADIYYWNNGATTQSTVTDSAGNYVVKIMNANGCQNTSDTAVVTYSNCKAPTGLPITNITSTGATLKWKKANCAIKYKVRVRSIGTATWKTYNNITTNSLAITGLLSNKNYEWQVQTICDANPLTTSSFSSGPNFKTAASFTAIAIASPDDDLRAIEKFDVAIKPNPAQSSVLLTITGSTVPATIIISDMAGKTLWQKNNVTGKNIILPLQNLSNGTYMVTVRGAGNIKTLKLLKE